MKTLFAPLFLVFLIVCCKDDDTAPPVPLDAQFNLSDTTINEGESIIFTDASVGTPTSWEWDFGGGTPSSSTDQNPTVSYTTPGVYVATLKVINDSEPNGDMTTKQIVVLPVNGLVAYYPFHGDASDESQSSFDGTVFGASLATDKHEVNNEAYQFDGIDDYISTSTEIDQLLENGFTFSTWIYVDQLDDNNLYTIISNYNGNSPEGNCNTRIGFHYFLNGDRSITVFYAWDGNDRFGRKAASGTIQLNTWYHMVATWDGNISPTGFELFLNTDKVDLSDHSLGFFDCGDFIESLDPFRIGISECGSTQGPCQPFAGKMDEFRIYDRPLNDNEILALSKY